MHTERDGDGNVGGGARGQSGQGGCGRCGVVIELGVVKWRPPTAW